MKGLVLDKPLAYAVHERTVGELAETTWGEVLRYLGPKILEKYGWRVLANQVDFYEKVKRYDILHVAGTGAGKTEATVFLAFERVLRQQQEEGWKEEGLRRPVIYLYPNNALLFDQEERLREHNVALAGSQIGIARYTSDMSREERRRVREQVAKVKVDIILMTVDMYKDTLFSALVHGETGWGLAMVSPWMVICDELDYYSAYSLAYLLALYRILKRYNRERGREVRFVFNSATIPNAEELAREVLVETRVVTGQAKHGRIQVFTYSQGTGLRDKEGREVTTFDRFLRKLLDGEIYPTARVVIYADNKFLLERVVIVEEMKRRNFGLVHGGLTRVETRETVKQFRRGEIRGLLVTRAVEAGVNFGELNLVVIVGYPSGGKRGVHQVIMRVARNPEREGQVFWFLAPRRQPDAYYLANPRQLQALVQALHPEPVQYQFFSEKILKMALLLCGTLGLTERDLGWVFPYTPPEYLEAKEEEVLTELLVDGKVRKGRYQFEIHLGRGKPEYFAQRFRTAQVELVVVTRANQEVGFLDMLKAARQGRKDDYLVLRGEVWRVVEVQEGMIIVEPAEKAWYSENYVDKEVRKGRGTVREVGDRVVAWYGEIEVTLRPTWRRIRELGSGRLVVQKRIPRGEGVLRYWTEGMVMEFKRVWFGREELTHLGAVVVKAALDRLGIDSSGLEVEMLRGKATRWQLAMLDRGAPMGGAKQLFNHVEEIVAMIRERVRGCPCGRYCEKCVEVNTFPVNYSKSAHDRLRTFFR